MKETYLLARQRFKHLGQSVFLMLYPTIDSFDVSFSSELPLQSVMQVALGEDFVIGVRGPLEDDAYGEVFSVVEGLLARINADVDFIESQL